MQVLGGSLWCVQGWNPTGPRVRWPHGEAKPGGGVALGVESSSANDRPGGRAGALSWPSCMEVTL